MQVSYEAQAREAVGRRQLAITPVRGRVGYVSKVVLAVFGGSYGLLRPVSQTPAGVGRPLDGPRRGARSCRTRTAWVENGEIVGRRGRAVLGHGGLIRAAVRVASLAGAAICAARRAIVRDRQLRHSVSAVGLGIRLRLVWATSGRLATCLRAVIIGLGRAIKRGSLAWAALRELLGFVTTN